MKRAAIAAAGIMTIAFAQVHASAPVAPLFDLECTGTESSDSFYGGKKSEPYRINYRVDLAKGAWCEGECKAINQFVEIQPGYLMLRNKREDTSSITTSIMIKVDRETGEHTIINTLQMGRDPTSIQINNFKGQCERREFSGFPEIKTKF